MVKRIHLQNSRKADFNLQTLAELLSDPPLFVHVSIREAAEKLPLAFSEDFEEALAYSVREANRIVIQALENEIKLSENSIP